jgi:hypothetical protein
MNRMNVLWCLALALASPVPAAELTLPRDGWASWQVQAVEDAPVWCCWKDWQSPHDVTTPCQLDEDRGSVGNRDDATTDSVRVYARMSGGKIERLRTLAASCPVEAATPIRDLGGLATGLTTDDSARWLIAFLERPEAGANHDLQEKALAALAMHHGDRAQRALAEVARGASPAELRKTAVFWLAILRGAAGAEVATAVMFNDQDPELRQHAAFAVSRNESPRAIQDLIRLGTTDKDGKVRAQAWFWLAQTGAAEAETAINAALRNDRDDHVREQAIFALSQLPDERAARALIKAAEDQSLSREQRKRAIFWLAQSDSNGAQQYLERVLEGKGTH